MTSFQNKNQIYAQLEELIPGQVAECKNGDELPTTLKELIIHNFQAKYVCYHKEDATVEVGLEEQEDNTSYSKIRVHSYKLQDAVSWIRKSFKKDDRDLKFYAQLLSRKDSANKIDQVVLV